MLKHLQKLLLVALLCVPFVTQAQCNSGAACNITISMADDYGDGWFDEDDDPFYINVYQGDSLWTVTLSSGMSGTQTISVCPNDTVRFVFNGDDYYEESSFVIYDGGGDIIASGACSAYTTGSSIAVVANACPTCFPPSAFVVDSVSSQGDVYFSWIDTLATGWDIVWGIGELDPDTVVNNIDNTTATEYTLYGMANGVYAAYVRANCGGGDYSSWVGPLSFAVGGCYIKIVGADSYGDGWNGGYITIAQGSTTIATWDAPNTNHGSGGPYYDTTFIAVGNAPVTFSWTSGNFASEVSFDIYDGSGALMHSVNTPTAGLLYTMNEPCPSCFVPDSLTVTIDEDDVIITWAAGDATMWQLVWDTVGVEADSIDLVEYLSTNTYTISDLADGQYVAYVRTDCGDDTSRWAMAIINKGMVVMNMPTSGVDTVRSCRATVYDDGGPDGSYSNGISLSTLIFLPSEENSFLSLTGSSYTESTYDYITVYEGVGTNGTVLFTDNGIDALTNFGPFEAPAFTLTFHSDGSMAYDGFEIHTTCIPAPNCPVVTNLAVEATTTSHAYLTWGYQDGVITDTPAGYDVEYQEVGSTNPAITTTTTDPEIILSGLMPMTEYVVRVAVDCGGSNGAMDSITFTTGSLGCAVIDSTNSRVDTIGTGTNTTSYFPVYTCYNYSLSQQIYTANELGGSGNLASISFMPSSVATPNGTNRTIEIYMAHVSDSTASSFLYPAGLTLVYSGTHQFVANQWNEIVLDNAFNYNGTDHLLVMFRDLTGAYSCSNSYYYHTATSGASRYVYQDSGPYAIGYTGGTSSANRMNALFNFQSCTQLATCSAPVVMIQSYDSTNVTLSWLPGATETSWDIEYREAGATAWTSAATGVSTTSYTITNLMPATSYEVQVVSVCTEGDFAGSAEFTTECGSFSVPIMEDFDSVSTGVFARDCWRIGTTNLGTDIPYPYVVTLQGSDNHLCLFYNGAFMVLPRVAQPLNALQVRFAFTQGGDNVHFLMGLLEHQDDPISNMIVLDTIVRSEIDTSTATVSYSYNFTDLPDLYSHYHLAFWDAFNENYSFIDNFVLDFIPTCAPVTGLTASNVTTNGADVGWTSDNVTVANYIVEYGPRNFVPGTGTVVTTTTTNITLSGLNAGENYDVYVYTACSATDTSLVSQVLQFSTQCGIISVLPYNVDFENIMPSGSSATDILPNCWGGEAISGTMPHIAWQSSASYYQSPTHSLYFNNEGIVALPEMSIPINETMISFYDYNSNPGTYGLVIGAVDSITPGFATSFQPIDTVIYTNGTGNAYQITSYLGSYTGSATRIAIKNFNTAGNNSSTHYIDDIVVDSLLACTPVRNLTVEGNTTNSITLDWGSYNNSDDSWVVSYDTVPMTDPLTGTVTATTTHPYTINGLTPGTDYYIYVLNDCGSGDSSTWTAVGPVRPGVWNMRANQTDTLYMCGGTIYDDGGAGGMYSANQNSYIILRPSSPNNVVAINGTAQIEGSSWDNLYIYDGEGTSGTALVSLAGSSYSSGTQVSATSTSGSLTIYFKSDGSVQYSGFELNVSCISTTCMVTNLMLDTNEAAMSNQLSLTWDANSASSYDIEYGEAGFTLGTGNVLSSTTNSITITGLNPATSYDVYVRSICSGNDTGSWTHQTYRTALCDNASVVYSYDNTQPVESYFEIGPIGNSCYNYSYVQTLIDSARFAGLTDSITAFAFLPTNTTGHDKFNNMVMWMANVPNTSLDTLIIPDETNNVFTKVIDTTSFNYNEADWQLFAFDTPFAWDGHSNVLVVVKRDNGSYSCTAEFAAHTTSGSATTTYCVYTDGAPIDPASPYAGSNVYDDYYNAVGDMMFYACGTGCSKPSLLTPSNVDYQGATLSWTGNATDYEVAVKAATDATYPEATTVTGNTYTASGLQAATMYLYHVRALCDTNEGLISDWREGFFTTDSLPCFAPTALHVVDSAYTTVTLGWTAGTTETDWNVHVWNTNFDTTYVVNSNPATVGGLATNMSYNAAVSALCGGGAAESDYSDTISFMTALCQVPTGLTATNITANAATITWNGTASSYELQYGEHGFPEGQGTVVTVNGTSFNLTGLDSETEYDVAVSAVCDAGNGVQSTYTARYSFETAEEIGIADVNGLNVNIYPNPASNSTNITLSGVTGEVTIAIIDMNGRTVRSSTMSCDGDCATTIEVSDLASGAYFVRISGEEVNTVKKLVVK
ncbi:MAG: fibronectin type III domain-containing protein [Bacteroidales bacterium]|nr:fibronectin type III domain-containing protein [Bacteroidales bacterium]